MTYTHAKKPPKSVERILAATGEKIQAVEQSKLILKYHHYFGDTSIRVDLDPES